MEDLKLEDYSKIKPYLDMANYEGYNSNFVTMMMWNHEYHIQYEIHEHFMVMLHNYKGMYFWAMPFTSPQYYKAAIDYMIDYSKQHQFDFCIDCAIESFIENIQPLYQKQLLFERTSYNDDYIYDRQMLQSLSGKKMQKRRNHYNAFIKEYPNYVYRDLDLTDDFDVILDCLNRWEYEKDDISESMTSEIRGIMYLLSSKHILDFEVGGIFINGQMEAFIIASMLKHSTIQIHVEKANKEIRGLYPAILKEMLEHHYPDAQYVNREEDMGLENLKKSKQALHPMKMIHKYRITLKNITISQANDGDIDEIRQLWMKNFKDETDESTTFYFQHKYRKDYTYILKNNCDLISVVQIVPMAIQQGIKTIESYFILGVCTKTSFENQGYMKQLMQHVLSLYKDKFIYLQAYVPDIYRRFGFHASHFHQLYTIDKNELSVCRKEPSSQFSLLKGYYDAYTASFDEYRIRDDNDFKMLVERCNAFNDTILVFKGEGYLIYHETDEDIYISEFIYLKESSAIEMLSYFKNNDKRLLVECDMKICLPGSHEDIIIMMSNQIETDSIDRNKYINEIY